LRWEESPGCGCVCVVVAQFKVLKCCDEGSEDIKCVYACFVIGDDSRVDTAVELLEIFPLLSTSMCMLVCDRVCKGAKGDRVWYCRVTGDLSTTELFL
jgi:hypothetical protein